MTVSSPPNPQDLARAKHLRRATRVAEQASVGWKVLLVKIVALGIIDALALYALLILVQSGSWVVAGIVAVITIAANVIYFSPRMLPAKYLAPGLIFLLVFQIFVVMYTAFVAFTNYGTGHNSTKDDAIHAIMLQNQQRVPDSAAYPLTIVKDGAGQISFLVTDPSGQALIGGNERPLQPADGAVIENGRAVSMPGQNSLDFAGLIADQSAITSTVVQLDADDPNAGFLRTQDGKVAYVYTSRYAYDEQADTLTDTQSGTVYTDNGEGAFASPEGTEIMPGWRVVVGVDNFARAFSEPSIRGPFFAVTAWTFAFAFLSVATTFILGLVLALVFNDPRMKSRKYYRLIMILPYAFPGFLSALVWAGMMNQEFGFINTVLFGGAQIPWLTNAWLAKISILIVNLWLGFPYMFLVTTGAIQSIPNELTEAAQVDGAKPFQAFRLIKFPLLLVSVAPLLISSFAFNFNNFNLIYMMTAGGPRDVTAGVNVGATDLLITMVYKIAFVGSTSDYGLASAFSIIIFLLVGTISVIAFRQTRSLEELN